MNMVKLAGYQSRDGRKPETNRLHQLACKGSAYRQAGFYPLENLASSIQDTHAGHMPTLSFISLFDTAK
ncbi:MAG: hypothetical protein AAFX87_29485 [Bacteroidota bacterium]